MDETQAVDHARHAVGHWAKSPTPVWSFLIVWYSIFKNTKKIENIYWSFLYSYSFQKISTQTPLKITIRIIAGQLGISCSLDQDWWVWLCVRLSSNVKAEYIVHIHWVVMFRGYCLHRHGIYTNKYEGIYWFFS